MSVKRKTLFSGTIGTTAQKYTVPVNYSATILSVTVTNKLNATVLFNFTKNSRTGNIQLYALNLSYAPYYFSKDSTEYMLGLGESITMVADTDNSLDVLISGYEESADVANAVG